MIIDRTELEAALKRCIRLMGRKVKSPFNLISLIATDGDLQITAGDGSTWMRIILYGEDGTLAVCVPGAELLDFVSGAGHDVSEVDLVRDATGLQVTCGGRKASLKAEPVNTLPMADEGKPCKWRREGEWSADSFRQALKWVLPAASHDITRPQLCAVLMHDNLLVACDGHRLHHARLIEDQLLYRTLVPRGCAQVLLSVLSHGRVILDRSESLLRFQTSDVQVMAAAVDVEFPPYENIIPKPGSEELSIEVEVRRLRSALSRLTSRKSDELVRQKVGPEETRSAAARGVQMTVNGKLTLTREGCEAVAVPLRASTHLGPDFVIGVDPRYIEEAIGEDGIRAFRFGDELAPIAITDPADEHLAVVMPMRM